MGFRQGIYSYSRLPKSTVPAKSGISGWRNLFHSCILDDLPILIGLPLTLSLAYVPSSIAFVLSCLLLIWVCLYLFRSTENSLVYARNEPSHSRFLCPCPSEYRFNSWRKITLYPDGNHGPCVVGYMLLLEDDRERSVAPTLYVLHGNAGNIGHRLPMCRLLVDQLQCNVFIIDYRGFGLSTGCPSEAGLYADVHAGIVHLLGRKDIATDNIFVFGQSLGGALAIKIATGPFCDAIRGVIVENSFTSMPLVARHLFSTSFSDVFNYALPTWAFANRYPSLERLTLSIQIQDRLPSFLFISGGSDEIIPPKMMQQLSSALNPHQTNSDKKVMLPSEFISLGKDGLVIFKSGRHNDTWLCENWTQVLAKFITCASPVHVTRQFTDSVVCPV